MSDLAILRRIAECHGLVYLQGGRAFLSTPTGVRDAGKDAILEVYDLEDQGYLRDRDDRWGRMRGYELTEEGWKAAGRE